MNNILATTSRRRPPRRAGNYYARVGGVAAAGVIGAYLVWAFVMKVVHPYQVGWSVARDRKKIQAELARQNRQNRQLEARLAYLKTPDGAETEARRAGFARPGELIYLLRPVKNGQ